MPFMGVGQSIQRPLIPALRPDFALKGADCLDIMGENMRSRFANYSNQTGGAFKVRDQDLQLEFRRQLPDSADSFRPVPGAAIGGLLLWLLGSPDQSEPYLKMAVGVYIVLSLVVPLRLAKSGQAGGRTFTLVGLVAGVAALTLGAIGPLIAPVFARHGFVKERLIATKAVCQAIMHLLKLPAFLVLRDLDVQRLGLLAVVMVVMVIPGTLLGKRLLQYVSEQHFILLYRAALLLAAGKLVLIDGVWKVWNGG